MIEAYKKAGKSTGKKYYMQMDGAMFGLYEEGEIEVPVVLSDDTCILESSYRESIENMINRVKVYDSEGNFLTQVENTEDIVKYGVFEKIYTKEEDTDMTVGATEELKTVEKYIKLTVLGEVNYWSGRSITVKDNLTGLNGRFLITNDNHVWQGCKYTTDLELKFMELK